MFNLTDSERSYIIETYRAGCTLPVDQLPYTGQFDGLHAAFQSAHRMVAKNVFWCELLTLRKHKVYGPMLRRKPARQVKRRGIKVPEDNIVNAVGGYTQQERDAYGGSAKAD